MKYIFYIILIILITVNAFHLSYQQTKMIDNLIKSNSLDINQRNIINRVLFISYEKFAIKKAIEFKKLHSFKCKNIHKDELVLSSKIGLFKSIKKYNGNSSFINFSEIYIRSELLKTLTSYYSLSPLPKNIRIRSKQNYSNDKMIEYKKQLNIKLIDYSNNWQFDKIYNKNQNNNVILDNINKYENHKKLWEKISKLEPFSKRIIY